MEEQDQVRMLETDLSRQLNWIGAADSRIAFVFTIASAMLGVLAAIAPNSVEQWSTAQAIWASAAGALALASLGLLTFATFPRTDGPKGSLIYFGGIAQRDRQQFVDEAMALDQDAYLEDLARQCHINAVIADRKFTWIKRSLISLYLAVVPWGLALYLLYGSGGAS